MKKFLAVVFLSCLFSTIVNAQSNSSFVHVQKPVLCGPLNHILTELAGTDVNEKPVWIGKRDDQKTEFLLFINFNTSAFTLIEAGKEIGCVLGIGYQSNFFDPPKIEPKKLIFQ
jgi:hypothetical protein